MTIWLILSGVVSAHGDIHERIGAISKQIEASPLEAKLYAQRAELERQHEDWQAALADYAKARQLDPKLDVDLPLGRTLLEAGRPEEALALLNRFLDRTPTAPQALVHRARTYVKLDRNEEALTDYRAALKCTPVPEPDLVIESADSLTVHGLEKEALGVLSAGIEKLGDIPSFILRAMDLEIATKNYDAALGRVHKMQQTAPRPEPWMARRASIMAQAGRIQESKLAWQALVEHLTALPNLERGSHAMSKLMEDAKQALASLDSLPETTEPSGK
jgi:tetratricopeptide (TPR) repeat protein